MDKPILKGNEIIVLRNGMCGVVTTFNNVPSHLIFKAYCNPITQYDADLCKKNHEYDVVAIYDGTNLEKITAIWGKGYNIAENHELIWERK